MDETIGVKGGKNDYKRTLRITQKQKKKLKKYQEEKEIKELEKEVKKKQKYLLIKTIPIAISIGTIKMFHDRKKEEIPLLDIDEEENVIEVKKDNPYKEITIVKNGKKQKITVNIELVEKEIKEIKEIEKEKEEKVKSQEIIKEDIKEEKKELLRDEIKEEKEENKELEKNTSQEKEIKKENINSNISFEDLSENNKNKLNKLKTRKIINVYEKELKDIRYELRELEFEYNVLNDSVDNAILSKEVEKILDKLNSIIDKLEKLKERIKIEDLDKYDDNYIYTLIEDYLKEFKDKKIINEIKDSPLYILISEKIDELDNKKTSFKKKVTTKKEDLKEREVDFEKLKDEYLDMKRYNESINKFYENQERLLEEIQKKIDNAVTVTEKVKVEFEFMNMQGKGLLKALALLMFIPGNRSAKTAALMTGSYLNFTKKILNPKTVERKYKVINVNDYSESIKGNINKIEEVEDLLSKNESQIDKLISKIKTDYKEYLGVISEADNLLKNLEKIKNNIREKEYEMIKMKEKQQRELERNNAKVLTRGEYLL